MNKASKYVHNFARAKHAVALMEMINCKFKEFCLEQSITNSDINEILALANEAKPNSISNGFTFNKN